VSVERFRRDILYLTENFEIVDLPAILTHNTSNKKRIAITFDDGFSNFYSNAYPFLKKFDIPVTVFVNPSFIEDSDIEQIKSRHALKQVSSPITMDVQQLNNLVDSELVTIGNHTLTHRDLSTIQNENILKKEILGAKKELEERFGTSINRFAYPYGRYNESALEIVQESHDFGVGTSWSLLTGNYERHRLPRIGAHTSEKMVRWELSDVSHEIRTLTEKFSL
jgi:peptidoglycan/xylan/chitin deacetylase (PgdA/CDA1 family)